jgi:predicted Fe-Mo cluster-binding NifX family protein
MRIAIPVTDAGDFNPHFGRSPAFEVFDVEDGQIRQNWRVQVPGAAGCGALPALLAREGVQTVLAGGMGAGAMANLRRFKIEPIAGASGSQPRRMLESWLAGQLPLSPTACHGHGAHGGRGHGHRHRHGQHGHCCTTTEKP